MNREKLWRILDSRCRNDSDRMIALLMVKMYQKSQVVIGKHSFSADLGVVQGGVLSPMLFNVYLEEALTPKPQNPHAYVCGVINNRASLIIIIA